MKSSKSNQSTSLFSSESFREVVKKKGKKAPVQTEKDLTRQICAYIRLSYPEVYFFTDPSGMYQKSWAAKAMLKNNRSKHCQLDLILLHPSNGYFGAIIELKREGEKLNNKLGTLASDHLIGQANSIKHLNEKGYYATWAIGFIQTKEIIDNYLKQ